MKPGFQTSELWALVAAVVNAETGALSTSTHMNTAAIIAAAVYAVCRTVLKLQPFGLDTALSPPAASAAPQELP